MFWRRGNQGVRPTSRGLPAEACGPAFPSLPEVCSGDPEVPVSFLSPGLSVGLCQFIGDTRPHPPRSCLSLFGLPSQTQRTGGLNNTHLFLVVLEAGRPRSWCLVRTCFLVCGCCPPPVSSHRGESEGALWGLFYKDTTPFHKGSPV